MERKKLIEGFANVDPARSQMQSNPVMKTFWFTGNRLMAYNGGMALSVPFKSEYQGAVQETIYPLLNSSGAPECDFEVTDKGMTVKAGASKFKLLTMSNNEFNFTMPKFPEDAAFAVADVPKFLIALKACKRSLGSETSEAAFKGVTMIASKNKLDMFAYDRITLTHCTVKLKGDPGFERVVVPTALVDQLLRITDGATELDMIIDGKTLLARSNSVTLWGRLEDEDRQVRPFLDQSAELRTSSNSTLDITEKAFAMKFPAMLERACIITQDAVEATKTKVTVADNRIFLHSRSTRGVVDDAIMPPKGQTHKNVELRMNPSRVLQGLELGSLSFTTKATILTNHDGSIAYYITGE
jgi:hypothetical protein